VGAYDSVVEERRGRTGCFVEQAVRGGEVAGRSIRAEEKEAEVVGDGGGSQEEARVNLLRAGERDRGAIGGLDEERELPAHTMDERQASSKRKAASPGAD
jgi:hypothetical protein